MPNLLPLSTCCVRLEPRSLPSTGITQLHRYYGPIRHPKMPSLSVTGVRLVVPDHTMGFPVLRALSLCACCRQYPGAAAVFVFAQFPQPCQTSPIRFSGRPAHRPFRGLLSVHSRCGLHTRAATNSWHSLPEGFGHIVTSIAAPVATGWSRGQVGLTPTGKRRLFTAHSASSSLPPKNHCRANFASTRRQARPAGYTWRPSWCKTTAVPASCAAYSAT